MHQLGGVSPGRREEQRLLYVRNVIVVKPWVHGWWEFGKSWSSFADLMIDPRPQRG